MLACHVLGQIHKNRAGNSHQAEQQHQCEVSQRSPPAIATPLCAVSWSGLRLPPRLLVMFSACFEKKRAKNTLVTRAGSMRSSAMQISAVRTSRLWCERRLLARHVLSQICGKRGCQQPTSKPANTLPCANLTLPAMQHAGRISKSRLLQAVAVKIPCEALVREHQAQVCKILGFCLVLQADA